MQFGVLFAAAIALSATADLRVKIEGQAPFATTHIADGDTSVFTPIGGTSIRITTPTFSSLLPITSVNTSENGVTIEHDLLNHCAVTESFKTLSPNLIERTVSVTAKSDMRYFLDFGWQAAQDGAFYSFTGEEPATKRYTPSCGGPEFTDQSLQTFPFMGFLHGETLYGIVGDSPGLWENRSFMAFDIEGRTLHFTNGDGSPKRVISIPREVDATTVYRATFDGWQHIEAGETQTFTTWIFASPAKTLYDVQLGAHLALANAKGWNHSGLEAILRNTSYMLLRRNLLRPESDYIFISGVGYGWKQWVSDGFWMSRGLDDPKFDAASQNAVFYDRIAYEDNAQYYLIWSVIVKRAGGDVDPRTVDRAYHFMRKHEVDGLYQPPRLKPDHKGFRTYHDMLEYEDGDSQSSNQGFHVGGLLAARELGYTISDEEVAKAKAGYEKFFNVEGNYMQTSLMQPQHIGQDAFYGALLTYAVFGEKLLPDDMVKKHLETTMKIQSPYGMRVISKVNGDLLDGHSGVYVYGGSWYLNDSANYLFGLIHDMDPQWVDDQLIWRLEKELATMPAFHESISTVDGHPHGHHLYSWNSGYWWLRREVRKRMGMEGPDPVEQRLDQMLGIAVKDGHLMLDPAMATLRPKP